MLRPVKVEIFFPRISLVFTQNTKKTLISIVPVASLERSLYFVLRLSSRPPPSLTVAPARMENEPASTVSLNYRRGYIIPRPGRFTHVANSSLSVPPLLGLCKEVSSPVCFLLWVCLCDSLSSLSPPPWLCVMCQHLTCPHL